MIVSRRREQQRGRRGYKSILARSAKLRRPSPMHGVKSRGHAVEANSLASVGLLWVAVALSTAKIGACQTQAYPLGGSRWWYGISPTNWDLGETLTGERAKRSDRGQRSRWTRRQRLLEQGENRSGESSNDRIAQRCCWFLG